jgi:uncharacterized protein (TIRG00374 family)
VLVELKEGGAVMTGNRRGLLLTSLGVVIFLAYLAWSNPFQILMEVGRFDPVTFLVAVLINYVGLVCFSLSWYLLLRVLGVGVSAWEAVQATFVSLFVVWMIPIPVGTEIIRAYLARGEENSDMGKAVASVVLHKAYYNIAFGALIGAAAIMVTVFGGGSIPVRPELVWFVISFAAVSSVFFGMMLSPRLLRRFYEIIPGWLRLRTFDRLYDSRMGEGGFVRVIDEIDSAVKVLMSNPVQNFLSLIMVAFHWSTGALTAYMVALSLGRHVDFWVIVLIYAVIEFIQQLNILIPSGLGVVDAGLTGAFVLVGVPLSLASAISLLTRLATYWFELALCAVVSFRYGYRESLKEYLE